MYRILLVDDEILVRNAIRDSIDWQAMDCELAAVCENGQKAAQFVQTHPVDIVLTDILMPYMDGMELAHYLHDNHPEIVTVIFSGFGDFEYAKQAIRYDVCEFLLKPVTAAELRETIEKMKSIVDRRREEKTRVAELARSLEKNRESEPLVRSRVIGDLVNFRRTEEESLEALAELGIELCAPGYRVAVFDMDLYTGTDLDLEKRQESAMMAAVLYNTADQLTANDGAGIAYQEDGNRVFVLFFSEDREDAGRILERCVQIRSAVKELIGMDCSVCLGRRVRILRDLCVSHDEAVKGLDMRYLLGGELLLDMEKIDMNQKRSIKELIQDMQTSLKAADSLEVRIHISRMEEFIRNTCSDKGHACLYMQQIIAGAAEAVLEAGLQEPLLDTEKEEMMKKVIDQPSLQKGMGLVKEWTEHAVRLLQEANTNGPARIAAQGLDYIRKNYGKADLNLNEICAFLNISTSYFSSIFKETTGETFIEALTRIRIENARKLLSGTMLKSYEVAEKVGYADPHYFGISFKKAVGMTPTEYAKKYRGKY